MMWILSNISTDDKGPDVTVRMRRMTLTCAIFDRQKIPFLLLHPKYNFMVHVSYNLTVLLSVPLL